MGQLCPVKEVRGVGVHPLGHVQDDHEVSGDNAVVVEGPLAEGYPRQAPYDVIVLGGSVDAVPDAIADQLVVGGRLVAVVNIAPSVGNIEVIHRSHGGLSRRQLYDAAVPVLPGFAAERGFVF